MQISILGIDIGKNSCSVVGVDDRGAVVVRRTMRRQTLIELVEKLPACVIAMEGCCCAHHLRRLFAARGHVNCPHFDRTVGISRKAQAQA